MDCPNYTLIPKGDNGKIEMMLNIRHVYNEEITIQRICFKLIVN